MIVKLKKAFVNTDHVALFKFNVEGNLVLNCAGGWIHTITDKEEIQTMLEALEKDAIEAYEVFLNDVGNKLGEFLQRFDSSGSSYNSPVSRMNRTSLAHTIDIANVTLKNNAEIKKWVKDAVKLHEYLAQTEEELTDEEVKRVEDMVYKLAKLTEPENT